MRLGEKYREFMRHRADAEWLEGTTAAGKTTAGALKFMVRVAQSRSSQHILSGLDLGTIEKNIITKPNGILEELGSLVEYKGGGSAGNSLPHILFTPRQGDVKTIYVLGYADKARWKKALGGQYGCLFIDEANVADMDFVREAVMRCDYVMGTLNPDDPSLPIYREFINKAVPRGWGCPPEILSELTGEEPRWSHWFFDFSDNVSLTPEKVERIRRNVPQGTKLYKNKVLGLRGRATGLVFPTFDPKVHGMAVEEAQAMLEQPPEGVEPNREERLVTFTSGLDTSYSQRTADTMAMTFGGITDRGRYILLDCREWNNRDVEHPLAPTDTVARYLAFLERNRREWGLARHVFVDSADQATLTELRKWKRAHPECMHVFEDAHKRLRNIDRIELQLGWMAGGDPAFKVVTDRCEPYVREMGAYSWDESKDSTPEDANDHCVQSCQYSWLAYRDRIGRDR